MKTPEEHLAERRQIAESDFQITQEDGLLSWVAKKVFGWRGWRRVNEWAVNEILFRQGRLKKSYSEKMAESEVRWAIDVYILIMTVLLVIAYILSFFLCGAGVGCWGVAVVILCFAFSIYRLGEIFSIFVQLHLKGGYGSTAPARAILNTVWHYVEITIGFATFYVVAAKITADPFNQNGDSLLASVMDPLYFSFVTITTLGYGDYSPNKPLGKLLVWIEVLCGLLLILIVIQRAISASMTPDSENPSNGSSDRQEGVSK